MSVITTTWGFGSWSNRANLTYVPANQSQLVKGTQQYTSPYGILNKRGFSTDSEQASRRPYRIQETDSVSYIQYDTDPSVIFKVVTQ